MLANKSLSPQWHLWPVSVIIVIMKFLHFIHRISKHVKKQIVCCRWKSSQHSQIPWTSSTESLGLINCWKVWGFEARSEEGNTHQKNPYFTIKRNDLCFFSRHKDIAWLFVLTLKFSEIIACQANTGTSLLHLPFPSTKLLFWAVWVWPIFAAGGVLWGDKNIQPALTTHPFWQHLNSLLTDLVLNCPKTQEKSNAVFKSE